MTLSNLSSWEIGKSSVTKRVVTMFRTFEFPLTLASYEADQILDRQLHEGYRKVPRRCHQAQPQNFPHLLSR